MRNINEHIITWQPQGGLSNVAGCVYTQLNKQEQNISYVFVICLFDCVCINHKSGKSYLLLVRLRVMCLTCVRGGTFTTSRLFKVNYTRREV